MTIVEFPRGPADYELINPLQAKAVKLRGYTNNNKSYSEAKNAIQKGYTDPAFIGLTTQEIQQHLKTGGWVGLVVPAGYIVVDVDDKDEGQFVLELLQAADYHFHAIESPRGYQFIFQDSELIKQQVNDVVSLLGVKVDYRLGGKGYIVAPAYNTKKRNWIHVNSEELTPMPFFFGNMGKQKKNHFYFDFPLMEPGRNNALYRWGCKLVEYGIDKEKIYEILSAIGKYGSDPPYPENELNKVYSQVYKQEPSGKGSYHINVPGAAGQDWEKQLRKGINEKTGKEYIIKCGENAELIIKNCFRDILAFDEFRRVEVIRKDLPWRKKEFPHKTYESWTGADDARLRHWFETKWNFNSRPLVQDAFIEVARQNSFHPIKEYLEAQTWDGVKRVETFFIDYLGADNSPYIREVTRKWFTAAVARIYEPGCKFDYMPVLVGAQGAGKSSTIAKLADGWFSDSLRNFDNKEAGEHLQSAWIFEIAELAAMRKNEIEVIKAFLSKTEDMYRIAYDRMVSRFLRQCVFIGTTNTIDFLQDQTGNRRFLPISVNVEQRKYNPFTELSETIISQLWAESLELYKQGEPLFLDMSIEEDARQIQEGHTAVDPRSGIVQRYLDMLLPYDWETMKPYQRYNYFLGPSQPGTIPRDRVCAMEIWTECFGKKQEDMRPYDAKPINNMLRALEWVERKQGRTIFTHYGKQTTFLKNSRSLLSD